MPSSNRLATTRRTEKDFREEAARALFQAYSQFPYLTRARTIHRTHKNVRMSVPPGSFLEGIYKDPSRDIVIIKSTQSGISEYLVVRAFNRAERGRAVFYVLPTFDLKNQFVKERIDKATLYSDYYRDLLGDAEKKFAESVSMKQFGKGVIAFVGSNTAVAFTSFAADDVIIDELDRCNRENIVMAPERQSASLDKTNVSVSNPTFLKLGIDYEFRKSDEKWWNIKAPCGHWVQPDFFKHVVRQVGDNEFVIRDSDYRRDSGRDVRLMCDQCGKPFNRYGAGEWVARHEFGRDKSGYQISQLFSSTETIYSLIQYFDEGLRNQTKMQRFYNARLGLAFNAAGAKIDRSMVEECADSEYLMPNSCKGVCVMGVDVGELLHVRVNEILADGRQRAVYIGTVREYEDLVEFRRRYNLACTVIDGLPEIRLSKKVAANFPAAFRAFYGQENSKIETINAAQRAVTVNRTEALDAVKEMFLTKAIVLPGNASEIPDYYDHLEAATRAYNEDRGVYEWIEGNEPDHYHHAEAYCQIARKLLLTLASRGR